MTVIVSPASIDLAQGPTWDETVRSGGARPRGAKYSPDQPRDDHGRFGETGDVPATPILAVPSELADLNEQSRAKWAAEMERYGVSIADLRAEIAKVVTPEAIDHARSWFPEANALSKEIATNTGLGQDQVAAALAVMSPRCVWEDENGEGETKYVASLAQFVADGKADGLSTEDAALAWKADYKENNDVMNQDGTAPLGAACFNGNAEKAIDIFRGDVTLEEAMPDNKARSFFDNIMQPGETNEATIDTHMMKAYERVYGVSYTDAEKFTSLDRQKVADDMSVKGVGYIAMAEAVRQVSVTLNEPPDVVEAAYWEQVWPTDHIEKADGKDWPGGVPRTEPKK